MRKGGGSRGEITVFLSLCLLCVFALLCMLAESARMAGSRYYFQTAVNGALDNLFSRYHRELWREYRILGLPYKSERELEESLCSCVGRYLETDNWYPMELETVEISDCERLTDRGGDLLAAEIRDYMKYGVWSGLRIPPEQGETFLKDIMEAAGAGSMGDIFGEQAREVRRLERVVEKIADCVSSQESLAGTVATQLAADDADGFRSAAGAFRREAGRMDGLMAEYASRAERLKEKMAETEAEFARVKDDLQGGRARIFEAQMEPYRAYVEEDGERLREIREQWDRGKANLELLERTGSMVDELEAAWETALAEYEAAKAEYEAAEAEREAAKAEDGAGEGADGALPEEYLPAPERPELSLAGAAGLWGGFAHSTLSLERGNGDKEKEGLLERVREMAGKSLMELVLPADMSVSAAAVPLSGLPSREIAGESERTPDPVERVLMHEYCGHFFTNALSAEEKPLRYESEYLLYGKESDRANLETLGTRLLMVRQGLNLIHILADPAKRDEARGLALLIVGAAGIAPLVEITAFLVMGVWAVGEAVMDLRTLFAGGKVPLWKQDGDWQLSLDGLLEMGAERTCPETETGQRGFGYEEYLKLLMFLTDHQDLQMRMLDLMQMNLQRKETGFAIRNCAYRVDICGKACGKPLFFRLPFVERSVGRAENYPLEAPAGRAY